MSISKTNKDASLGPSYRDQIYSLRLSSVQKQLNFQCCQHDSLMPLLQLATYQSYIYRWQANLKNINKKIQEYETRINGLNGLNIEDNKLENNQLSQLEASKLNTAYKIKSHLKQIRNLLDPQSRQSFIALQKQTNVDLQPQADSIQRMDQKVCFQKLQEQSKQSIKELKRYVEMSLALFRNEIMISQISQDKKISNSRTLSQSSQGNQQMVQNIIKSNMRGLRKNIQCIRNGLSIGSYSSLNSCDISVLTSFHEQNMIRISSDLVQINQLLQYMNQENPKQGWKSGGRAQEYKQQNKDAEEYRKEIEIIKQKLKLIGWQIKGLKKKYTVTLNEMYKCNSDAYKVNQLQKSLVEDLNSLCSAYQQVSYRLQQNSTHAAKNTNMKHFERY